MNIVDYHVALTLLFFVAFAVMVIWVFLPSRRKKYQDIARQPVEDDRQAKPSEKEHQQ